MHNRFRTLSAFSSVLVLLTLFQNPLHAEDEKKDSDEKKKKEKITYDDHVKPIFRQKCFGCHNPDKKSGNLDLTTFTTMMEGGGSGQVIEAGDPSFSYLYMLVSHEVGPYMPPNSPKIADEKLATIKDWIAGGALENKGSKSLANKPKTDFSLKQASSGRPDGPPPMPERLPLEPVVHTSRSAAVTGLATSPWAPLVAVSGQKQVLLYHSETLELQGVLPFPEGIPHSLMFSRNGSLLLAGGGEGAALGKVVVWNVKTGERVIEVGDEYDAVLAADISSNQTLIALGGPSGVVRVYSTKTGEKAYQIEKHTDWIYSVEFSPDSVLLATADRNGGLFIWEGFTGREFHTLDGHKEAITSLSWRADSNVLASGSEDGNIHLWEMKRGRRIKNWGAHGPGVSSIEFARDGRIVSCGRDRRAKLWDQNGKQQRAFDPFGDIALEVTFCDETDRVIAGDWTGAIRVWNAKDGKKVGDLSSNPPTLDQRVAAARKLLNQRRAEHQKLSAEADKAQKALQKLQADLQSAQKKASEAEKRSQELDKNIKTAKQTLAQTQKAQQASNQKIKQLEPVVPLLKEASEKAEQAASKLSGDKDLASAAGQLKKQFEQKNSQLNATRKNAKTQADKIKATKQMLATLEKEKAETAKTLENAKKQMESLKKSIQSAKEKAAQAKQAADKAAQALSESEKTVKHWQDELAFAQQKKGKNQQASVNQ